MNKRIRYSVVNVGAENMYHVSNNIFKSASGTDYLVYLYPNELRFSVVAVAETGDVTTSEGVASSMSSLKLKAKKALCSLGVSFDDEKRVKKVV